MPGLVSTLLNHAYSTPSRLVQTFLQVTEQVWKPIHLSRFSTMPICALIFMYYSCILNPPFRLHPTGASCEAREMGLNGSMLVRQFLSTALPATRHSSSSESTRTHRDSS